jgi:8-oxo-dGTP diphosphatase
MIEVACAIIMRGKEVLITQRSEQMPHPLYWEFPGGKLKPGESPEKCIVREIREELHVNIKVDRLLPSVIQSYENQTIKLIPFICTLKSETIELQQHKSYKWIRRQEVDQFPILEADMKILERMNGHWTEAF